jgi:hypothetical protein
MLFTPPALFEAFADSSFADVALVICALMTVAASFRIKHTKP